jgi:hypothetical protein
MEEATIDKHSHAIPTEDQVSGAPQSCDGCVRYPIAQSETVDR